MVCVSVEVLRWELIERSEQLVPLELKRHTDDALRSLLHGELKVLNITNGYDKAVMDAEDRLRTHDEVGNDASRYLAIDAHQPDALIGEQTVSQRWVGFDKALVQLVE